MTKENWKEIHEEFGEKPPRNKKIYQEIWEINNLTYQDAQEWIPADFEPNDYEKVSQWKNHSFTPQETKSWSEVGLKPTLEYDRFNYAELAAYLRFKNIQPNLDLNLEQSKEEFNTWKEGEKPAKEYLEAIFPKSERSTITRLDLYQKNLTGELDLNDFVNLGNLNCSGNKLTNLDLSNCKKSTNLSIHNNSLHQDLSFLKDLVNLKSLVISNNPFYGSLEFVQNLKKLKELSIGDTDIDSGLEYLPESVERFWCSASPSWWVKKNYKVKQLAEEFGSFKKENGDYSSRDIKLWKEARQDKQQIQTLQKQQSQFQDQETQINYLELRVQELTNLIKTQKEKIISAFLRLFPEKDLLQELIIIHLEFIRFKEKEINSPNYGKKCREYKKKCQEIEDKLWDKLDETTMNGIQGILTDCENLIRDELELETRISDKVSLIENQNQSLLEITGGSEEKALVQKHKAVQLKEQEQLQTENNHLKNQLSKIEEITEQGTQVKVRIFFKSLMNRPIIANNKKETEQQQTQIIHNPPR